MHGVFYLIFIEVRKPPVCTSFVHIIHSLPACLKKETAGVYYVA